MSNTDKKSALSTKVWIIVGLVAAIILAIILIFDNINKEESKLEDNNSDNTSIEASDSTDNTNEDEHTHTEDTEITTEVNVDDGSIPFQNRRIYPSEMFASSEYGRLASIIATSRTSDENQNYPINVCDSDSTFGRYGITGEAIEMMMASYPSDGTASYDIVIVKPVSEQSDSVKQALESYISQNNNPDTVLGISETGYVYMVKSTYTSDTAPVILELLNRIDEIRIESDTKVEE